jgi:hypothetical protein
MAKARAATRKRKAGGERLRMFLGSSAEALPVLDAIHLNLQHDFYVTPWPAGVFESGNTGLEDLERQLDRNDLGLFVFSPDDVVMSRGTRSAAVRDNVLIELGLFIGRLGRSRSFLVTPKGVPIKIPSDLIGFSPTPYDHKWFQRDPQPALSAACREIVATVKRRMKDGVIRPARSGASHRKTASSINDAAGTMEGKVTDLMDLVRMGKAGVEVQLVSEENLRQWGRNMLAMALESLKQVTAKPPEDAYVVWLRPPAKGKNGLTLYADFNLPPKYAKHYHFALGEGLAGTVWQHGAPAVHSRQRQHEAWKTRADCQNASYVAVPVGAAGGAGGVLGFGSDRGFAVNDRQRSVLATYAAVAAALVPTAARK